MGREDGQQDALPTGREKKLPVHAEDERALDLPPLAGWMRSLVLLLGLAFLALGFVGLLLPVIPQTIPLALGAALLSLASERCHRWMASLLARWPRAASLLSTTRARARNFLHRFDRRTGGP